MFSIFPSGKCFGRTAAHSSFALSGWSVPAFVFIAIVSVFSLSLLTPHLAIARDGLFRIDRYIEVTTTSTLEQKEPLLEVVSFRPVSKTVGKAIREALAGTGYRIDEAVGLPGFDDMELPRVHRSFSDTQVIEILHALAGPAYDVVIDPVYRTIGFNAGFAMEFDSGTGAGTGQSPRDKK